MIEITKSRRPRRMARDACVVPDGSPDAAIATEATTLVETAAPLSAKSHTKAGLVIGLLARQDGASLADMCEATGWLPHTCRAFLTGLRKKGMVPEMAKRDDGVTAYRLVPAEVAA